MPSSRNQIWCHRRHEWAPYPFPVCRPFSVINSGDSYESKVDEPDDNSYGPVHYISAQLVEEALKILDELPREHTTKHVAMPVTRKPNGKYHMQNPDLMFQRSNSIAPAKNFLHVTFPKASPLPELEPLKENETSSVTWVTILTYIMGVLIVISTLAAFLTGLFLVPCIRQRSSLRGDRYYTSQIFRLKARCE